MFCLKHVISYLHICDYLYRTVTLNREMVVSGYLRVFGLLIGTVFLRENAYRDFSECAEPLVGTLGNRDKRNVVCRQ